MRPLIGGSIILALPFLSCSMMMMDPPPAADVSPSRLLVLIESNIFDTVSPSLAYYEDDLLAEGGSAELLSFPADGSALELKEVLESYRDDVSGYFLVGTFPAAWYEQTAFGTREEFPVDLFFMDFDATWTDSDGNGIYDAHSSLHLTHYVSRMDGTSDQIKAYFEKLHNYRTGSSPYLGGAFIFKDEDWFDTYRSSSFGLDKIYSDVRISENAGVTMKNDYIYSLAFLGADYIYQWIHATPTSLYIDEGDYYNPFRYSEIPANNIQGRFFNMFDCKGARFTQSNLGMTYLNSTEYGLAVTGSTKVGGNYYPLEFHRTLVIGSSWGSAYKSWYNYFGSKDDEWFLGMVILGDPALRIQEGNVDRSMSRSAFGDIIPPDDETVDYLKQNLMDFEALEEDF